MATSKKKDRIANLMKLRNTLNGGVKGPTNTSGLTVTFPLEDHKLIIAHVNKMLSEEGIFILSDMGVDP